MENTRRRRSGGLRKIITAVFAVAFIASTISTITAFAAANLFKIQNAELSELSTTAEGSISSFDEENIVSNVTFHKLGDFSKYTITLKNTDNKDHVIESITDDNESPYISYEYDQHIGEQINAGENLVFVVTAKYSTSITDVNQRAQVSNVKFFIHFTDLEEEIPIVPNTGTNSNTGDYIHLSVLSLIISATGLIIISIITLKKHKKASKFITASIVAVAAIATTAIVKAATIEINSFTISTSYNLKDKLVVTYADKDGNDQELVVSYDRTASIPDQSKDGYTLTGWEDEDGNPVDLTQPITEDIKIHPVYRVHNYTVKFNGNGATGSMADLAMTYDETKALPSNAFNFPGHTYTGWDTRANGSGVHYDNESEVKNLTTEDNGIVTLYAQWSINPFHIDYDGNGATSGEMATTNCEYDQACQLRDNAFEKYGYDFAGWKYNDTIYADKADVTNIIDHGTITMVAQWTPHVYTVTYTGLTNEEAATLRTAGNPDNYTIEMPSFTLKNPEDRKDADGDTRERFVGWVEVIEPSTSVTLPMVGNLGNKTFNATWETVALPEYDITYNYNGGNVATANPTKLNKEQSRALNEPVKTGYTFTGWTGTTISGDTPVKPYTIPAPHQKGVLEYTAHYRAHTYTVNFDINTDDAHVSGTMQPLVFNYDEEKALTANAFTRTGYTFAGWKLSDTEYTDGQTIKNLTAEDGATVTLKAQWIPTQYTIIFHANNDNVENPDAMAAQVVTYDVETTLNPIAYTWWQHKLVEWTTNANGTGTKYADKATIKNLNANGGEVHLYAKWREIDAALDGRGNLSNKNITTKLRAITIANPDAKNFLHYPNGEPSDEIKASATDLSGTIDPIYAWAEGENIYWWSEDVKPRISTNNSVEYHYYGVGKSTAEGKVNNLEYMDLTGFDTTGIVGARSPFEYTNIRRVDISDWDLSNATDMGYFAYNSQLTSIKFPEVFDVQKVTNVAMAFNGAKIVNLDLGSWKTRDLKNASSFINMSSVEEVKFSRDFSTANVTTMASMFAGSSKLSSLDLSMFNTANVQNMSGMFNGVSNMATLDISGFDTGAVTNMSNMFSNMSKLETLTVGSNFTAASVISMASIFVNDTSLTSLDLSSWGATNSLTNLNRAFSGMTNLATLDLTGWDLSGVNNLDHTFHQTRNIETIYASSDTDPSKFTEDNLKWTFEYATPKIVGGAGSTGSLGMNGVYARIDDPDNGKPGYFTIKGARYVRYHGNGSDDDSYEIMPSYYVSTAEPYDVKLKPNAFVKEGYKFMGWATSANSTTVAYADGAALEGLTASKTPLELYAVWNKVEAIFNSNTSSTLNNIHASNSTASKFKKYPNGQPSDEIIATATDVSRTDDPIWVWPDGENIYFWSEDELPAFPANMTRFFNQTTLSEIDLNGTEANVTDMTWTFANTSTLKKVDLGNNFDTTNNTSLSATFGNATNLETIIFGDKFTTKNVTTTDWMFNSTGKLKTADVASFDVSKVQNMVRMFVGCGLENLDLSSWNTPALKGSLDGTFGSSAIKSITFGQGFDTSNVTNMSSTFANIKATSLDLSMFNTEKVTTMAGMFSSSAMTSLDLSNFSSAALTNMGSMFYKMGNLTSITFGPNFTAEGVTNITSLFDGASSIEYLDLTGLHIPAQTSMNRTFMDMHKLKTLDITGWDLTHVTNTNNAFANEKVVETIYASSEFLPENLPSDGFEFGNWTLGGHLVGGAGTTCTTDVSGIYARIDDPDNDEPGYFTIKGARYIRYHDNDGDTTNDEANYALMNSHYLKAGDSLTKNAFTRNGYEFAGWKDADGNDYTDEQVMTSLAESKTPLELYAQWGTAPYTVTFNANGGEMLQSAKTVTHLQPYGELPTPVRYNYANSILGGKYSFKEWNTKADGTGDTITPSSIYANTGDTTLYAIWNDRFTVTIYNGESETPTIASYGIDDIVYLNAQNVAGKQFLYWEVDGAKKSYTKNYSMRMFQGKDLTIRAIYGSESDLESQQPGTYISDIYRQYSDNKIVVRSYSYAPDGYEIVKAGVIATLDANIANGTFDDQTATYPRAESVNGSSDNYYFTWTKSNVTSEQTVYVKAYLVYKDADGVEYTIYGDLVTATLTE